MKVIEVIEVITQREYKNPVTGGRSIRLDIYAEDSDGKVYNIEVQNDDAEADIRRAGFHGSMLDTSAVDMFYAQGARRVGEDESSPARF